MANNVFIGRENELAKLQNAYNDASNGNGKLVLVEGSAGIGKSGLVREFIRQLDQKTDAILGISECNDKENLNAYAPFKDILLELNSQTGDKKDSQKKDEKLKKLKQFVSEAGTSWIGLIPVVGGFASTGIETYKAYKNTYKEKAGPEIESENDIYRIFENEFRRLAKDDTVVIFIDDLQWADASSLNLIFALGKTIRANPFKILLICSYRANEIKAGRNKISETGETINTRHPFSDKLNELRNYIKKESHIEENVNWFEEIYIKPFDHNEINELINTRFPNNHFNPEFFENTENLTDGHPLYIVEILDYLERNGIIIKDNGGYSAREIKLDDLPVSVNAIISEKVERLNNDLRKVLSYASVNGEEFAVKVIEKILKMDELDLLDYLEELSQKHGLLIAEQPVQVKDMLLELYTFSQTLVHKFIYENMDGARRRALHRKIADTMNELYGEAIDNNKDIKDKYNLHKQIGQGLIDGVSLQISKAEESQSKEETPDADTFLSAAATEIQNAKESFEQFAMDECYDFVDKALAFLSKIQDSNTDKLSHKFETYLLRCKARQWQGHYQKALETAEQLNSLAKKLSQEKYLAQSYLCIAKASTYLGDSEKVLPILYEAVDIYKKINDLPLLWEAYMQAGKTKHAVASYDDAIAYLGQALKVAEDLKDENKRAESLHYIGGSYSKKSEYNRAIDYYNQALKVFVEHNNQYQIGEVYNKIGLSLHLKGVYDEAYEYFDKALNIAKEQNDNVNVSNRVNNKAIICEAKGDYNQAIEYYKKSLAIDRMLINSLMTSKSLNNIGNVYVTLSDYTTAMEYFNQSLEIIESLNDKLGLSYTYECIGQAYDSMGEMDKALDYLKKSLEIDIELGNKSSVAAGYVGLGNVYYNSGDNELAKKYYLEASELFEAVEDWLSMSVINNNLGSLAFSEENYEQAIPFYNQAMEYYLEVGDKMGQSLTGGNIARCYVNLKNYDKAIEIFEKIVAIAESVDEKMHLYNHYNNIAVAYYSNKAYEKSIIYYKKLVIIKEALNKSHELGISYDDIGDAYRELENIQEAIKYFDLAITNYRNQKLFANEDTSADLCRILAKHASLQMHEGNYSTAIDNYKEAISLSDEIENRHDIAIYSYNAGLCYARLNNNTEALQHFNKARTTFIETQEAGSEDIIDVENEINNLKEETQSESVTGHEPPASRSNTGIADPDKTIDKINSYILTADDNYENKNYEEALQSYRAAYELSIKMPANNEVNKITANLLFNLGMVNKHLKKYPDGKEYFKVAITFLFELYGEKHLDLARAYSNLGDIYYFTDKYKKAIKNHKAALSAYMALYGREDDMVAWSYYDLGLDYYWSEQYELSIENLKYALEIRKALYGEEHKEVANSYAKLGDSYYWNKQYDPAIENQIRALNIRINLFGKKSEEADRSRLSLGKTYYYADLNRKAKDQFSRSLKFRKRFYGRDSDEYKEAQEWLSKL